MAKLSPCAAASHLVLWDIFFVFSDANCENSEICTTACMDSLNQKIDDARAQGKNKELGGPTGLYAEKSRLAKRQCGPSAGTYCCKEEEDGGHGKCFAFALFTYT